MCALEPNLQKRMSSTRLSFMINLLVLLSNEIEVVIYALLRLNEMELETLKVLSQVKQLNQTSKLKRSTTQLAEEQEQT